MKIILAGTNHAKEEEEVEVVIEYNDEDTWTLALPMITFTISDLSPVMDFLKRQFPR